MNHFIIRNSLPGQNLSHCLPWTSLGSSSPANGKQRPHQSEDRLLTVPKPDPSLLCLHLWEERELYEDFDTLQSHLSLASDPLYLLFSLSLVSIPSVLSAQAFSPHLPSFPPWVFPLCFKAIFSQLMSLFPLSFRPDSHYSSFSIPTPSFYYHPSYLAGHLLFSFPADLSFFWPNFQYFSLTVLSIRTDDEHILPW